MRCEVKAAPAPSTAKRMSVYILTAVAVSLVLSGLIFGVYSMICNITFQVLNTNIPGLLFGALVVYFGVRGLISVNKLRKELYSTDSEFSWSNFKRQKKIGKRIKK